MYGVDRFANMIVHRKYKLNETSGTSIIDSSGSGNNLTIAGTYVLNAETSPVYPRLDGVIEFEQAADADKASGTALDLSIGGANLTWSLWVKVPAIGTANTFQLVYNNDGTRIWWLGFYNKFFCTYYYNGTSGVSRRHSPASSTSLAIYEDEWINLIATQTGTGATDGAIYLNGVAIPIAATGVPAAQYMGTTGFVIGEGVTADTAMVPVLYSQVELGIGSITADEAANWYIDQRDGAGVRVAAVRTDGQADIRDALGMSTANMDTQIASLATQTSIDDSKPTRASILASSGLTIYAIFFNSSGQLWTGSTFETYNASNWSTYDVAMTETGTLGYYSVAVPSPSATQFVAYSQVGGSPATSDRRLQGATLL